MEKLKGQESVETIMSLMKKHQPCNAHDLIEQGFNLHKVSAHNILSQMHQCGCVALVDRVKTGTRYKLTGLSPFGKCELCNKAAFRWNLVHGLCCSCRLGRKGCNQQADADFAFLRTPAFQLINKVFAQGARRMETSK
ncbi:hypothetical protein Q5N41_07125 [Vibrio cholerae]|uniref:hypothetical protein n=1 Tax=Vibrio cholerae TaxID=666 RepID=UPI0004E34D3C|nr:hypothetical protein [Vibrio cholerae]EGR4409366.1 hypothetical protein [Vibrio cholerae]EKB3497052.1 hypothetical protein [Vibrio cholerae]EKF9766334.1 hypothetical protein [Vibrio cholerae]ELL0940058.1 hypothetical protein [Vibrio cholerae]ELL8242117.1 hypothetical protein [Vibrio cholerae]